MGSGGACGHHHPVDPLFPNDFGHLGLGILGTRVEVLFGIDDEGKSLGVLPYLRHVDHSPDVDPAMADKDPHSGDFSPNVRLGRHTGFPSHGPANVVEEDAGGRRRRRAFHHGLGNVLGSLERAADEDAGP